MDVAHADNLLAVADALAREKERGHRGRRRKNRISASAFGVEAGNAPRQEETKGSGKGKKRKVRTGKKAANSSRRVAGSPSGKMRYLEVTVFSERSTETKSAAGRPRLSIFQALFIS
jgi:hypothetical protein